MADLVEKAERLALLGLGDKKVGTSRVGVTQEGERDEMIDRIHGNYCNYSR